MNLRSKVRKVLVVVFVFLAFAGGVGRFPVMTPLSGQVPAEEIGDYDYESEFFISVCNVRLNGGGTSVKVNPGDTVRGTLDYHVWNPGNCPGCIVQIVVGLGETPITCVYNGIPGVNPGLEGTGSFSFTAPEGGGEYYLYYTYSLQYTCEAAIAEYCKREKTQIGTVITDEERQLFVSVSNAKLNGQSGFIEVNPGNTVRGTLSYHVWNPGNCPGCIVQIVPGFGETPITCVYNGVPGVNPGLKGTGSFSFTAPKKEGTYIVYYTTSLQYTCDDAMAEYCKRRKTQIGMVVVKQRRVVIFPEIYSRFTLRYTVIDMYIRVNKEAYSNKIYDLEIFPENQRPQWDRIEVLEAPKGWKFENIGNGVRFYTETNPLILCQGVTFRFRVEAESISWFIRGYVTDKTHRRLGMILSTRQRLYTFYIR